MSAEATLAIERKGAGTAGRLSTAGGVALVTLLAVGAGAVMALLLAAPPAEPDRPAEAAPVENPALYASETGPLALVAMEPVVTNISAPPSTVIRIEASLVLREGVAEPAVLATQIRGDTLAFARSLELAQVEGARGLLHLREDLKERAMLRSPFVADYVIHSLIAQ